MKNTQEETVKFVHSQTINLKASEPLIPVELDFGDHQIKKFLIERVGSNKIRFVLPISPEEYKEQKEVVDKKIKAIEEAQNILNSAAKDVIDKPAEA